MNATKDFAYNFLQKEADDSDDGELPLMHPLSDQEFDHLVQRALDELPHDHVANLDNVAITFADDPTPEQLTKQGVRSGQLLLGLYEGIPLTARLSSSYSGVLPDKITLFKTPLQQVSRDDSELFEQIKRTLWHEIAHHYGLDHNRIHALENNSEDDGKE